MFDTVTDIFLFVFTHTLTAMAFYFLARSQVANALSAKMIDMISGKKEEE